MCRQAGCGGSVPTDVERPSDSRRPTDRVERPESVTGPVPASGETRTSTHSRLRGSTQPDHRLGEAPAVDRTPVATDGRTTDRSGR